MSAAPAMTMQDLELEHAELLPARETLCVSPLHPRYYASCYPPCSSPPHCPPCYPGGPVYHYPGPVHA